MEDLKELRGRSLYSLWRSLVELGYDAGSYETFLRWVHRVEKEAIKRGYLKVRKGKRRSYVIKNPENLVRLMCEFGYAL